MITIAPGVRARLRGAQETYDCVAQDFYLPTQCLCCGTDDLFCIMDASYVLCPMCKVVSPLDGGADADYQGGVGLGFGMEELRKWQYEILMARQRQQPQQQRGMY